jgi:hypothetical protein
MRGTGTLPCYVLKGGCSIPLQGVLCSLCLHLVWLCTSAGWGPPWGSPMATVSSSRCTCSSAGGAPAPLHCELSISLYCCALIKLQACLTFLPLTLCTCSLTASSWLEHSRAGKPSPCYLFGSGDQSDPKRLSPLASPLLCSSLRNVVNADLFYLLALQQACSEGVVLSTICPAVAVWCLFTLVRPTQVIPVDRCLGGDLFYSFLPTGVDVSCGKQPLMLPPPKSLAANSPCCYRRRCSGCYWVRSTLSATVSTVWRRPERMGSLDKAPASSASLPSRASSHSCSDPTLLAL